MSKHISRSTITLLSLSCAASLMSCRTPVSQSRGFSTSPPSFSSAIPLVESPRRSPSTTATSVCGNSGYLILSELRSSGNFAAVSRRLNIPIPAVMIGACCLLRHSLIIAPHLNPVCGIY